MKSNMFRQYIIMDTYFCVIDFLEGMQISKTEIEPLDITSGILQNTEATMSYIVKIVAKALELRDQKASNRYGDVVDEVMDYIEKNYADEELSLNLLASHINQSFKHGIQPRDRSDADKIYHGLPDEQGKRAFALHQ